MTVCMIVENIISFGFTSSALLLLNIWNTLWKAKNNNNKIDTLVFLLRRHVTSQMQQWLSSSMNIAHNK